MFNVPLPPLYVLCPPRGPVRPRRLYSRKAVIIAMFQWEASSFSLEALANEHKTLVYCRSRGGARSHIPRIFTNSGHPL